MPISQPKPPEPRKTATRTPKPAPVPQASVQQIREDGLKGWFDILAGVALLGKQYADAGAISQHGPAISEAAAKTANTDEKLAGIIDKICTTGPYAGLVAATMPLAIQLLANHGRIDASKMAGFGGVVPPAELEQKVKEDLQQKRDEFARRQGDAQNQIPAMAGQEAA